MTDDFAILARTRLGLIGVDDEKIWTLWRWCFWHEAPLHTRGEASTAATAQARGFHFLNNRVLPNLHQGGGFVPIATFLRRFQGEILIAI